MLNQFSKDILKNIETSKYVIKLDPEEASYYYNLALAYEQNSQLEEAKSNIEFCLSLSSNEDSIDSDHISEAIDIYAQLKDKPKV